MPDRPFTVYFDTNFFIWLAQASPEDSDRAIRVFNERKIRYVHSSYIILELLSGRERSNQDQRLLDRIKRWDVEPFPIRIGYSKDAEMIPWDILLLAGNERKEFSEGLKEIFDQETVARSFSHLAGKPLSVDDSSKLIENLEPFFSELGIDAQSSDFDRAVALAEHSINVISQLSSVLPTDVAKKLTKIDFSKPLLHENSTELEQQLRSVLEDQTILNIEREGTLLDSVLALDDRPFKTATGNSSNKDLKKLGNSMRDAVHMNAFLNNTDQIDLLQVDSRQMSLISRNKPKHLIRELGFSDRCFSTQNLESTVLYLINCENTE